MLAPARILGPGAAGGGSGSTVTRAKSEVVFTGQALEIGTEQPLIALLKVLTPASGSFAPFFTTADNKFKPLNFGSTCLFKLNLVGTWDATGNQYIDLKFPGSTGNNVVYSKAPAQDADTISISTFFSIDADGNLATNGSVVTLGAPESKFTASTIVLIAEQVTWS